MTSINLNNYLRLDLAALSNRSNQYFELDQKNLRNLLQMALEVELFTIPLYMSGMYSIQGFHQINTGNNFYQGRQWPGMGPKFYSQHEYPTNQDAFNKVFKVFIEEMLHLQIAANLNNAYGNKAKFTNNGLINADFSWKSYSAKNTQIPGIIDFTDLKDNSVYKNVKVNLDALNAKQIKLFLAIESSEHDLQEEISDKNKSKYQNKVPYTEEITLKSDLMFGSISGLYTTIISYLMIKYEDGQRLYSKAYVENSIQRDHFNNMGGNNKKSEYNGLRTNLADITLSNLKFKEILRMINGILDQGEGLPLYQLIVNLIFSLVKQNPIDESTKETIVFLLIEMTFDSKNAIEKYKEELIKDFNNCTTLPCKSAIKSKIIRLDELKAKLIAMKILKNDNHLLAVQPENRVDDVAVAENHKSFNDVGKPIKSASAAARGGVNGQMDHHEIFEEVKKLIVKKDFMTWDLYHKNDTLFWKKSDLITNQADYNENLKNYKQLPIAEDIANAMNIVTKDKDNIQWLELLSKATTGTLKGLLIGMEDYWSNRNGQFPSPAMVGSGDRMSICWALLGKSPDLQIKPDFKDKDHIRDYHACQGLYMPKEDENEINNNYPWIKYGDLGCASPAIYHSCKGTNTCKSEGGCGFVQAYEGGSNCSSSGGNNNNYPMYVTPPGSNNCGSKGGCAVPISALQMFPAPYGDKQLMKYKNELTGAEETINFEKGELVYDVAWKVYTERYKQKFNKIPKKPKTNILRLIFPPST